MSQDSVTHQKRKKVPEEEGSGWTPQCKRVTRWTLSRSRENGALMEPQAATAWARTRPLSSLLVPSPSLSRRLQPSESEKPHGRPPSDRTGARFTDALRNSRRWLMKAESERSSKLLCQPLCTASLTLLGASERIQHVFPNFALPQARKGVVFSRVGSEWFLSWSH